MDVLIWIGIFLCISQSAIFSGLNLALFSISKLKLEIESKQGNKYAKKVLEFRQDSNFLLSTILWGNVGINVLLTLLSGSVMTGVVAFVFSTMIITFFGEILPQAWFSRNAMHMVYYFSPFIYFYQFLLFPLAKSTAILLDKWLGKETVQYFREKDIKELLHIHVEASVSDIDLVEARGAANFLALDDITISGEGEVIDPRSIIKLGFVDNLPQFPKLDLQSANDPFLKKVEMSGKKWVILVDKKGFPVMALNSDSFLRDAFFHKESFNPLKYCHRPIIVKDSNLLLGNMLPQLKVNPERSGDDVIDEDMIIYWGRTKKIITGSDILGRLLRGIVAMEKGNG